MRDRVGLLRLAVGAKQGSGGRGGGRPGRRGFRGVRGGGGRGFPLRRDRDPDGGDAASRRLPRFHRAAPSPSGRAAAPSRARRGSGARDPRLAEGSRPREARPSEQAAQAAAPAWGRGGVGRAGRGSGRPCPAGRGLAPPDLGGSPVAEVGGARPPAGRSREEREEVSGASAPQPRGSRAGGSRGVSGARPRAPRGFPDPVLPGPGGGSRAAAPGAPRSRPPHAPRGRFLPLGNVQRERRRFPKRPRREAWRYRGGRGAGGEDGVSDSGRARRGSPRAPDPAGQSATCGAAALALALALAAVTTSRGDITGRRGRWSLAPGAGGARGRAAAGGRRGPRGGDPPPRVPSRSSRPD